MFSGVWGRELILCNEIKCIWTIRENCQEKISLQVLTFSPFELCVRQTFVFCLSLDWTCGVHSFLKELSKILRYVEKCGMG